MVIKKKIGICKCCLKENEIVYKTGFLCFYCNENRKRKKYYDNQKKRIKSGKSIDNTKMVSFFKKYWDEHPIRRCYECGCVLYQYKSWHIHHILEKSKYKDLAFDNDNIVYVCLEHHSGFHTNPSSTPKLLDLYIKKLNKYNN